MKKKVLFSLILVSVFFVIFGFKSSIFAADVTSISLSITVPKATDTPATTATVSEVNPESGQTGTINITKWKEYAPDGNAWQDMTTEKFRAGYRYLPVFDSWRIWYTTYNITNDTVITVNGQNVGTYGGWNGFGPLDYLKVTKLVVDVIVPKVGAHPTKTVTVSTLPEAALKSDLYVNWFEGTKNDKDAFNYAEPMSETDVFKEGKYYTYRFNEKPLKEDYVLADERQIIENGVEVDYYSIFSLVSTYTVTFDPNGGTGVMGSEGVPKGTYILPKCTFKAPKSKEFKGWALTKNGKTVKSIDVTKDVTVYAIWEVANPKTGDTIIISCSALAVSLIGIYVSTRIIKNKKASS